MPKNEPLKEEQLKDNANNPSANDQDMSDLVESSSEWTSSSDTTSDTSSVSSEFSSTENDNNFPEDKMEWSEDERVVLETIQEKDRQYHAGIVFASMHNHNYLLQDIVALHDVNQADHEAALVLLAIKRSLQSAADALDNQVKNELTKQNVLKSPEVRRPFFFTSNQVAPTTPDSEARYSLSGSPRR